MQDPNPKNTSCKATDRRPTPLADAGFLTILVQDPEVHGLEFLNAGQQWQAVPPAGVNALTINVGDQAQVGGEGGAKACCGTACCRGGTAAEALVPSSLMLWRPTLVGVWQGPAVVGRLP